MSRAPQSVGVAARQQNNSYGPDHTLVQLGDWLTNNAGLFEAVFAKLPHLAEIRIVQDGFEQHPELEHEIAGASVSYYDGERLNEEEDGPEELPDVTPVRHLKMIVGQRGTPIVERCVLNTDVFFHEVFDLRVRRERACNCTIRYFAFHPEHSKDFELLEQRFDWAWQSERYVGSRIELRLWSPYIPEFLAGPEALKEALRSNPALVYEHEETVPFKEEGFCALFLMRRAPTRIEYGSRFISVIYTGENQDLRGGRPSSGA